MTEEPPKPGEIGCLTTLLVIGGGAVGLFVPLAVAGVLDAPDFVTAVAAVFAFLAMLVLSIAGHRIGTDRERRRAGQPVDDRPLWRSTFNTVGQLVRTFTLAALGLALLGGAVVAVIVGGSLAYSWWNESERAERAWQLWQSKVCVVSKIEKGLFGSTTCRRCKVPAGFEDEMLYDRAISAHVDELGGIDALKRGVEVCK